MLRDKVILITGGSSGIGLSIAESCMKNNAYVIITGRDKERLQKAKNKLSQISSKITTQCFDISNHNDLKESINDIYGFAGKIDGLVNNAPSIHSGLIKDLDLNAWRTNFKANLDAVFSLLNILLPKMMEAKGGSIVNIASVVGLKGTAYMSGYGAAKAGLINLTKSAAIEAAPHVRVNCVIPGAVMTEALKKAIPSEEMMDSTVNSIPLKRIANPEEIAEPVVFLLSNKSSFITGAELVIDGGKTADLNAGN